MKKKFISLLSLALLATVGFTSGFFVTKTISKSKISTDLNTQQTAQVVGPELPKVTTLYFVGDMMLDRSVRTSVVKNFGGDYNKLFEKLGELKNADILFGNLEGDVSDIGNNVGSKYSFRMDPLVLPALRNAGFDIVSFANNHVGDWNVPAFTDTLARLSSEGILQTGAGLTKSEAEKPAIIEKNGVRFGFIGFSDVGPNWLKATSTTPGILLASDPRIGEIIKNAKADVDVLITSFHWGIEYKKVHNVGQEKIAHLAIDSGADMVIGHHPHVIQDIEIYKDKPIVYSLGNFIFDQYFSKDTMEGMLFEVVYEGKDLKETKSRLIKLNSKYQPEGIFEIVKEEEKVVKSTCPQPKKTYEDYTYLDVGQTVSIPDTSYIPSDLVLIDKNDSIYAICIKSDVNLALNKMIKSAKDDGHVIKVSSGFRSYTTQKAILAQNIKDGNKNASIAVAKPGHSEHQLGVAVDLTSPSINNESAAKKFETTKEAQWLKDNSYKYGFIQSYPEDKEDITGYMYEAWHYRYVGIDNAKEIEDSGQTVNEFLKEQNRTI